MCSYTIAAAFQWPLESFVDFKRLFSFHSLYTCFVWQLKALLSSLRNCWKHLRPPSFPLDCSHPVGLAPWMWNEGKMIARKLEKRRSTELEVYNNWQTIFALGHCLEFWASPFCEPWGKPHCLWLLVREDISPSHILLQCCRGKETVYALASEQQYALCTYPTTTATRSAMHGENESLFLFSSCL